jgi:hypothetical protein
MPILAVSSLLRVGGAPVPSLLAMLAVVVARSRIDNRIGNNRQNRTLARTLPRPSTRPAPPSNLQYHALGEKATMTARNTVTLKELYTTTRFLTESWLCVEWAGGRRQQSAKPNPRPNIASPEFDTEVS